MYKTKVVTQEVKYECCDMCGEDLCSEKKTYYRTSEYTEHVAYALHYECVDSLIEKNVTKEARQAAEKKANDEKDYRGTYVGDLRHLVKA